MKDKHPREITLDCTDTPNVQFWGKELGDGSYIDFEKPTSAVTVIVYEAAGGHKVFYIMDFATEIHKRWFGGTSIRVLGFQKKRVIVIRHHHAEIDLEHAILQFFDAGSIQHRACLLALKKAGLCPNARIPLCPPGTSEVVVPCRKENHAL